MIGTNRQRRALEEAVVEKRKQKLGTRRRPTHRAAGATIVVLAALQTVCGGNESTLEVIYQIWDAGSGCYQTCGAVDPPADLGVSDTCDTGPAACDIVPGETSFRVIALYDNVLFDDPLNASPPTLTAFVDGVEWAGGEAEATDWIPHRRNAHEAWFETNRNLPYVSGESLWFRVLAAPDFFEDSIRFPLHAPDLALTVDSCADTGDCTLPAGLGNASVVVDGPQYLESPLQAWQKLDGTIVTGSQQEVTLSPTGDGRAQAELTFPVPAGVSSVWEIVVQMGDLEATSVPIRLREPQDIELAVSPAEPTLETAVFGGTPDPQRAAGDLETCRELYLAVLTPDIPPGGLVILTTSFGDLEGKAAGNPASIALDSDGFATAHLTWDSTDDTSRTVQITASAEGLDDRVLTFDLEPVYPESAVLLPPPSPVAVAGSGSQALSLSGWFVPPQDAMVSSDLDVWLVVDAQSDPSANQLPCGAPLPTTYLRCDPGRLTGPDAGGCLLTPGGIGLDPDGTFTIDLASGVCFAGEVDISVYGYRYQETEGCLGERAVSSSPEELAGVTVVFQPSEEIPSPTPATGSITPTPEPQSPTPPL